MEWHGPPRPCHACGLTAMAQPPSTVLSRLMPAIVLAGLVILMLGAWWVFPRFQAWMAFQDCVATGRTNC
jgi:hypothetical protein